MGHPERNAPGPREPPCAEKPVGLCGAPPWAGGRSQAWSETEQATQSSQGLPGRPGGTRRVLTGSEHPEGSPCKGRACAKAQGLQSTMITATTTAANNKIITTHAA